MKANISRGKSSYMVTCKRQKIRFSEDTVYYVIDATKQEAHGPHDSHEKHIEINKLEQKYYYVILLVISRN